MILGMEIGFDMIVVVLGILFYWAIWSYISDFIVLYIPMPPMPVKHFIYLKKNEPSIGWTISWFSLCIVRLDIDGNKEFKIFFRNK